MAEQVTIRGENGLEIVVDLPLSEPLQWRLDKGDISIVEPGPEPEESPAADEEVPVVGEGDSAPADEAGAPKRGSRKATEQG